MLCLTRTTITSVDLAHYGVSHAKDWVSVDCGTITLMTPYMYEGISKSFEPNMERARNLDLFCFIFQRSPLPTPHTCPI